MELIKELTTLNEGKEINFSVEAVLKGIDAITSVRGARVETFKVDDDEIFLEVEFDFPEHLVKSMEIKKAGAPTIKKVTIEKSPDWRHGLFGVAYTIELTQALTADEVKLLKSKIKVEK